MSSRELEIKGKEPAVYGRQIIERLHEVMKHYVGKQHMISGPELFRKVYDHNPNIKSVSDWYLWECLKRGMNFCRARTQCFIVPQMKKGKYYYCVVSRPVEAEFYISILDRNIKCMEVMKEKATRAAQERWYRDEWTIPTTQINLR